MKDIQRIGVAARYSDLVTHADTAYFSGYVPETTLDQGAPEQTRDILGQIEQSLKEIGSDKSKLIEATIWLADMASYAEMNSVWDAWVAPGRPPTRACVEAKLASPEYALEIRVLAAR